MNYLSTRTKTKSLSVVLSFTYAAQFCFIFESLKLGRKIQAGRIFVSRNFRAQNKNSEKTKKQKEDVDEKTGNHTIKQGCRSRGVSVVYIAIGGDSGKPPEKPVEYYFLVVEMIITANLFFG